MAKITRMNYNERDAADSWRRIFSFFDAELRGKLAESAEADAD